MAIGLPISKEISMAQHPEESFLKKVSLPPNEEEFKKDAEVN